MAWTTPRTWVAAETVTAALMNTHLRDNLNFLHDSYATLASPTFTGTVSAASVTASATVTAATVATTTLTIAGTTSWGASPMGLAKAAGDNAIEWFGATLVAGTGLRIPSKAGIPVDGDYTTYGGLGSPGHLVVDTSNSRLYVRTGTSTWKYAALA